MKNGLQGEIMEKNKRENKTYTNQINDLINIKKTDTEVPMFRHYF